MDFLRTKKIKILISLIVLFVLFHVYKFVSIRVVNMDLPKGKIVFSSGVDGDDEIYTMNINGTNLKQLTCNFASKLNIATDNEPSFSLDGKKIVFSSSRFGEQDYRVLTNAMGRPVGGVFSGGKTDIFIMDSNGSNQTLLNYQGLNSHPFFSPDGKKIIYNSNNLESFLTMLVDAATFEHKVLYFGGGQFEFSLDSKRIFNNRNNSISITDLNGGNSIKLVNFFPELLVNSNKKSGLGIKFAISPDENKIAVVVMKGKNGQLNRMFKFYLMKTDGSDLSEVFNIETEFSSTIFNFKYAPGRDNVIFDFNNRTRGIYSLNMLNKNLTDLTYGKEDWNDFPDYNFTFTPDGKRIVFVANIYPKNYQLTLRLHNIKAWVRYLLLWRKIPSYDNKYLCIMDMDGKNYRRIAKLPIGTELGRDFIHWEK